MPLEELLTRTPGAKIPQLVIDLIDYLRLHGMMSCGEVPVAVERWLKLDTDSLGVGS